MRRVILLGCAMLLACGPGSRTARSQEPELQELPETTVVGEPAPFPANPLGPQTVVTPQPTEIRASQSGSSLTVITREEIVESRQTLVLDVLRRVPGLDVVQGGPPGGLSSVFLRGANSQHTKVLLDGVPLNDPSNASRLFDFSTLTTDNIEQIEVLRGPQSLLYGSDAIGGVINIVTRRGEGPPSLRASAMGGSYGTRQQQFNLSGGTPLYHYSLGGSYFDNDGFSAAAERLGNPENDGYRNGTLSGRFGWTPSRYLDLDYVFRYIDAAAEVDDFSFLTGLPFDNPFRANLSNQFFNRVQARSELLDGDIDLRAGFSLADHDRFDTDSGPFLDPLFAGQTRKADVQANLLLFAGNTFTLGADYFEEEARSSSVPQQAQNDAGFYVQDQLQIGERWFTTGGYRWDDHSAAGHAETYRATTLFAIHETGTALRGSIGTGFRAPALAENFFPFGNQNLRPETSKGWDYGIEQGLMQDRLVVGATYFRNDITNLIIFDPNTFVLDNIGQALATGVELTSVLRPDACTDVTLAYTRTDTRDLATGLPLLRRPRDKFSMTISRRLLCDRARANLFLYYVGDRRDTQFLLEDYVVVNASGSYDWSERLQLFARVDNLFNERYEEVAGFGVAEASAYGGARIWW